LLALNRLLAATLSFGRRCLTVGSNAVGAVRDEFALPSLPGQGSSQGDWGTDRLTRSLEPIDFIQHGLLYRPIQPSQVVDSLLLVGCCEQLRPDQRLRSLGHH
jgi:hypothetical protein